MMQPELVQDCGVEVVNADRVLDDGVTEVVSRSVAGAAFDSATGHPRGEGLHVVVSARETIG